MAQAKKKKKFFDIEIPIIGKDTQLLAYEPEELDGRIIKYDLTRLLRGKSVILIIKVKVQDGKPVAFCKKLQVMPYFLRRMMRKGTNYIEDSFSADCNDAEVVIKPFLITRRKVSRAIRNALRKKTREECANHLKDKNYEEIFDDLLKGKFQKILSLNLKKVYPLSFCDIRIFEVKKEK
jgi:ribosomal protein S3AE